MSYADIRPGDDLSYAPPRGNVLLLSCMDLRLTDNIVHFMNHDNLENRYDHVIFAGAALGALGAPGARNKKGKKYRRKKFRGWKKSFFQQLKGAVTLHDVRDIYILEHRNCGAYHKIFHIVDEYSDSTEDRLKEAACHEHYASRLEKKIKKWAEKNAYDLTVRKFLMGLRGEVSLLG